VGDRDLRLTGIAIMATFRCPRGTLLRTSWGIMMNPSDHMKLRNKGRTPLFTRQMLGVREAERDRRRHGR
jgi:hypothetical protein